MDASILIVDDDDALRSAAEEYLEFVGYSTVSTASAEEALEILNLFQPDIVLTDISMQGMNGLDLTRIIKKSYSVEVIVMTGYIATHSYEEAVNAGASDFIFKPFRFEELNLRLKRVIREMELKRKHAEMIKKLEELAVTDGLTGLYNQRYFYEKLEMEIERYMRYDVPLSLMLFDIDCFKAFNDTYGHLEGDKVLITLAKVTRSCLRSLDSAYRYGGEEFTVILPETELNQAGIVAERIRTTFAEKKFIATPAVTDSRTQRPTKTENQKPGEPKIRTLSKPTDLVTVTISIGVTQFTREDDIRTFIKRADAAMYQSKERGRNRLTSLPVPPMNAGQKR